MLGGDEEIVGSVDELPIALAAERDLILGRKNGARGGESREAEHGAAAAEKHGDRSVEATDGDGGRSSGDQG